MRAPDLSALDSPTHGTGDFQRLALRLCQLSPITLCAEMLAGAPATSATIGCVDEDVRTVVDAASAAVVPLKIACDESLLHAVQL